MFKVIARNPDTGRQYKKWTYESIEKFNKYGADIVLRMTRADWKTKEILYIAETYHMVSGEWILLDTYKDINSKMKLFKCNQKNNKFDIPHMETAQVWAKMSSCERRKVGALLAKGDRPLNTGYNGTVSGTDNNCEKECPECKGEGGVLTYRGHNDYESETCPTCQGKGVITNEFVVHAEKNLIAFCAKEGIPTDGCTVYVTLMPCTECASLMVQAGIKKVVYEQEYRDTSGVDFLKSVGVEVEQFKG